MKIFLRLNCSLDITFFKIGNKFLFFNYVLLIMLLQLSWFFPSLPPLPSTSAPSGNLHTIVPIHGSWYKPFGYSSWLFCNYLLVLLNSLTSSPIPPLTPPIWWPSKRSLYPWFCLCCSCLLGLFLRFNCWQICIFAILLFIVLVFFLNKSLSQFT